jgi:DNA-binding response OmpR family regulator
MDRSLTDPVGSAVAIGRTEYALLLAFLEAPERLLSRDYLLRATRTHGDIFDRSIDVQVMRLRRTLQRGGQKPCLIRTVRGLGYVFSATVERFP